MCPRFRHRPVSVTPIFAAGALALGLVLVSPAAAEELLVKNNADVPVRVVVKNGTSEVGHADRIDKKSSGKVTLNPGVSLAKITPSVEATALGVSVHCSASKSGSQYEVKCDAVASAPAAPPAGGASPKRATRNLEIQNDLKNPVTVMFSTVLDGNIVNDKHDINVGASATFTIPVDSNSLMGDFNVIRHLDMERVVCGSQMRYAIPPSQQKFYVTPADGSAPPPTAEKRADSRPCLLSQTSRTEKADPPPKTGSAPPATPATGGKPGANTMTKFVVENDLKDPVQISTMGPFTEEHMIDPKQSITFTNQVPHPNGDTVMEVFISRSVNLRMFNCGVRLQYVIPPTPEVKFYVTRVAGSEWPPKPKPGEQSGGGAGKTGSLPPPPSCELTRSQNVEK